MGLLAAPPKVGKSWLVNNVALASAAGGSALGVIPVKRRPVLLMALEDGHRRLQSRFRTLMEGQSLPAALEVVTRASPAEALVIVDEFCRRHRHDAPLVIIDTLGKIKPPKGSNEDSYQADYRVGSALKRRVDDVSGSCLRRCTTPARPRPTTSSTPYRAPTASPGPPTSCWSSTAGGMPATPCCASPAAMSMRTSTP